MGDVQHSQGVSASEMTCIVSSGALNSTHSPVSTVKAETILPFRPTDRDFSKLALLKSKLHFTMGQQQLETLLLASVKKNILLELDDAELVARFASRSDRQMMLDYV